MSVRKQIGSPKLWDEGKTDQILKLFKVLCGNRKFNFLAGEPVAAAFKAENIVGLFQGNGFLADADGGLYREIALTHKLFLDQRKVRAAVLRPSAYQPLSFDFEGGFVCRIHHIQLLLRLWKQIMCRK